MTLLPRQIIIYIHAFKCLLCRGIIALWVCAFFCGGYALQAHAQSTPASQNITPSNVYQNTEKLRLTLDALGYLNTALYQDRPTDSALRHPRHVMQKVRECHMLVAKLLLEKGINIDPLPELYSIREIRPADVNAGMEHLLKQVERLNTHQNTIVAPYVAGKLPNDVYNNLQRICHAIQATIVPADVYRVAQAVKQNMQDIYKSLGYETAREPQEAFSSKVPGDVYRETWAFLIDLRTLALNPDFAIPGGVVTASKPLEKDIIPQDVIALMNDALAETNAIKYALYLREPSPLPEFDHGKTPSDVFAQIYSAHLIVKDLITLENTFNEKGAD